ncbi:MAG: GTPase HflX [Clostridia bacterium]|nr:GTPase HflX [Clostridia bacterium]
MAKEAENTGFDSTDTRDPDAPERVVLVGVSFSGDAGAEDEAERSIEELALLAESAGAVVVGQALQRRERPDGATFVGRGKLEEIRDACEALDAGTVVFDDELSGAQIRNIEDATGRKVLDRTLLIMDIFAQRARSREGRLQVELAQQKYRLSRLVGMGKSLSRLGGGIGTRGPGESRLESDRRHIARRVKILSDAIEDVRSQRQRTRENRRQSEVFTIAFVGYTNAGKSTLINALCDSSLYAEDRVFATLDPAVRKLPLDAGVQAVAVDTVGFIRKLPHHLVEAFKSTLEEAVMADLIVHVVDAADPDRLRQMEVAEGILDELGASDRPRLTVFNKTDRVGVPDGISVLALPGSRLPDNVFEVSAVTGQGVDRLRAALRERAGAGTLRTRLRIPYRDSGMVDELHQTARVESLEYREDSIEMTVVIPVSRLARIEPYRVRDV